jgi:formylglycine-generating enzyme required for sulfatase activity
VGPPVDSARVLRGGSWNNNQDNARSANRNRNNPNNTNNIGFRVASSHIPVLNANCVMPEI